MNQEKIAIVGAGLAGSLLGIKLAKRGYRVEIYERRADMRKVEMAAGRSINLALSDRGIRALESIGIEKKVLQEAIPMYGRLIHTEKGSTHLIPYSAREGEYINSVSRAELNKILMNAAESEGVGLFFEAPCSGIQVEQGELELGSGEVVSADVIFGTDGGGSRIREAMLARTPELRFHFSQQFLDHGYKELSIPPQRGGGFRIEKNALHIWPRGTYMMIGLPNFDGSFTMTLFLPFEGDPGFHQLTTEEKVKEFFAAQFPDAGEHMPTLWEDFSQNPVGLLGTIKCYPWQMQGKSLLLGDAAHAIVPFYGQGMNCAFEDCMVLEEFMDSYPGDWEKIFMEYQQCRKPDTDAIADLAEENFYEMRDHVADPLFVKKRKLELRLEQEYPEYYSKYSLVTFREDLPYSIAKEQGNRQDAYLMKRCREIEDIETVNLKEILEGIKQLHVSNL